MLLAELALPPEELAFGHTKIFIRSPRTVSPGGRRDGAAGLGGRAGRRQPHGSPRPGSSWVTAQLPAGGP